MSEDQLDRLIDALNRGERTPTEPAEAGVEDVSEVLGKLQQLRQVDWPDGNFPDRMAAGLARKLGTRPAWLPFQWRRELFGATAVLAAGVALAVVAIAVRQGHVSPRTPAGVGTAPPAGLSSAAVAFDGRHQTVVVIGGYTSDVSTPRGETWTWNGSTWSLRTNAISPSPREFAAMAYDEAQGVSILFGGSALVGPTGKQSLADQADTWAWDGTGWTRLHPAQSPPAMNSPVMAYDPALRLIVLFGKGETWTWDGNNWSQLHPSVSPPPMEGYQAGLAYHASSQTLVLFGSQPSNGGPQSETWTFDGSTWTRHRLAAGAQPSEILFSMAPDDARGTVVLFDDLGGTWTWDGRAWSQLHPATSPSPRQQAMMAYDAARRVVVLVGGYRKPATADTWTWDGTTWRTYINGP